MTETTPDLATKFSTREQWLQTAIECLRANFKEDAGVDVPEVHVSIGFPAGASAESGKVVGQCWASGLSADGRNHIFISPALSDPAKVLATLVHELCHAVDNCQSKHGGEFKRVFVAVGMDGKAPTTIATTVALDAELSLLALELGAYPHGALQVGRVGRKLVPVNPDGSPRTDVGAPKLQQQQNRQLLIICRTPVEGGECGYKLRGSASVLALGIPECPLHHVEMERG